MLYKNWATKEIVEELVQLTTRKQNTKLNVLQPIYLTFSMLW